MEIEGLGPVVVREGEPHDLQAPDPHPQGLMRAGNARVGPLVQASLAGLAQGALTLGWGVSAPWLGQINTIPMGTGDTVWPASGADRLNPCGVVEERWSGYHDTSSAP